MAATPMLKDNDTLLVVGAAPCVWDDLEAWWELEHPHDICVINQIGTIFPCGFKHAFSFHAQELVDYGYKATLHSVNRRKPTGINYAWKIRDTGGSSGFMAARCALRHWGYHRVVVAGMPIDRTGHEKTLDPSSDTSRYTDLFLHSWEKHYPRLKGSLRSMSGNTRKIYGPPTKEWLNA